MKQLSSRSKHVKRKIVKKVSVNKKRKHPLYGTSKLEVDFANDFLNKLGVKYTYQFEAKDIGRFYDFAVFMNGNEKDLSIGNILLIEIDGSYYHSDPRVVKEENMNRMQKHNKIVDGYKDKWALMHGIPIMRIWEKDIRENPSAVMRELRKRLNNESEKKITTEKKNKRHVNKFLKN